MSRFWCFQPFHGRIKLKHTLFPWHEKKQMFMLDARHFCASSGKPPGRGLRTRVRFLGRHHYAPNREQLKVLQGSMDCESHGLNRVAAGPFQVKDTWRRTLRRAKVLSRRSTEK
jgi:hypothetical protein